MNRQIDSTSGEAAKAKRATLLANDRVCRLRIRSLYDSLILGVDDPEFTTWSAEDHELPAEFLDPETPTQDCRDLLDHLVNKFSDLYYEVELIEHALRRVPTSTARTRQTRQQLRRVLAGLETGVLSGLDRACLLYSPYRKESEQAS